MDLCVQEGALCMIAVSNSSDWCWKYVEVVSLFYVPKYLVLPISK